MRIARWPSARFFPAQGAPKFWRFTKTCVISTPRACFFYGSERTVDSNESAGEAIRFTQRTLPGKNKILCAWRAEIPEILQIFPILSQDVGINFALSELLISTPRACLDSNATFSQSRASVTPYDLRSARFPGKKIKFCALGAPKFREFCNSFLGFFAQILQYLDAGRFLIRMQT